MEQQKLYVNTVLYGNNGMSPFGWIISSWNKSFHMKFLLSPTSIVRKTTKQQTEHSQAPQQTKESSRTAPTSTEGVCLLLTAASAASPKCFPRHSPAPAALYNLLCFMAKILWNDTRRTYSFPSDVWCIAVYHWALKVKHLCASHPATTGAAPPAECPLTILQRIPREKWTRSCSRGKVLNSARVQNMIFIPHSTLLPPIYIIFLVLHKQQSAA